MNKGQKKSKFPLFILLLIILAAILWFSGVIPGFLHEEDADDSYTATEEDVSDDVSSETNKEDFTNIAGSYSWPLPSYAGGTSNGGIEISSDGSFAAEASSTELKGTDEGFLVKRSIAHGTLSLSSNKSKNYYVIKIASLNYDKEIGKSESTDDGDEILYTEFDDLYKGKELIVYKSGVDLEKIPQFIGEMLSESTEGVYQTLFAPVIYDKANEKVYWSKEIITALTE